MRPTRRRIAGGLLPLGLACLVPWLLPAGGAFGQTPAKQPTGGMQRLPSTPPPGAPAAASPRTVSASANRPAAGPAQATSAAGPGRLAAEGTTPAAVALPAASTTSPAPPISEAEFQQLLRTAGLDRLDQLCRQLVDAGDSTRLRLLRQRLLTIHPAPQPLAVVLANAEVMLSCRMPDGALTVLDRIGPARGAEQVQWLSLQWRAANAAMDHRRAALALERLTGERPDRLESLLLPLRPRSDGSWASRSALEVLASHLESAGRSSSAAALLQLSRNRDAAAAERLAQAARLLADLPPELREPLFERALEQAAAVGSWGLVGELLAAEAALPASPEAAARTAERRLRLSRRLDDAYGEWRALLDAADPASEPRRRTLVLQLRSPLTPGGHAASLSTPAPLPPLQSALPAGSANPRPNSPAGADDGTAAGSPTPRPAALPTSGSPVPPQP